ncbi:MAG: alpha/beta fold hydrolase [Acidobacteriota bacterium]
MADEGTPPAGAETPPSRRGRWWRRFLWLYLILLVISHGVRWSQEAPPLPSGLASLQLPPQKSFEATTEDPEDFIRFAYRDLPAAAEAPPNAPPALLIHGSPGDMGSMEAIAQSLSAERRVLVVDLPGFGDSTRSIPDYSIQAHARYCELLLEGLGIRRAHLVGFSMGGGVVLHMAQRSPDATASVTLLAAIGVQELELLGEYHLNHAVHGLQAAALWASRELVPHFGAWDRAFFGYEYARNFFDTDQRPLREILREYPGPMLILHGEEDMLVPAAAAREHHRLVPQSELVMLDRNHFFPFMEPQLAAEPLASFMARSDAGETLHRDAVSAQLQRLAAEPFDPTSIPPATGFPLFVILISIAAATMVSEDLSCIGAGLLVAAGRISFLSATVACGLGIFIGDMMLYLAGRWVGGAALSRPPLSWMITPTDVRRSARWFDRKGLTVIFLSRFLPGTRLPTYFAAGLFRANFLRFALYFAIAVSVWTPILVGLATLGGEQAQHLLEEAGQLGWLLFLGIIAALLIGTRILLPSLTYRGRRLLLGKLRRLLRWEYWSPWVFYPPVVLWILWLGMRYRSLTLFTCVNPALPAGGFVGESKEQILDLVRAADPERAPHHRLLPLEEELALEAAREFLDQHPLPAVLKPELGERGAGVVVARDWKTVEDVIRRQARGRAESAVEAFSRSNRGTGNDSAKSSQESGQDSLWRSLHNEPRTDSRLILQEYVGGPELGVFWLRDPATGKGQVFAITEKVLPSVTGDGQRNLEDLILADRQLLAMAPYYLADNEYRIEEIPKAGQVVPLTELGTHCRGAVFLNGERFRTPQLESAVEALSQQVEGMDFGRYDLRGESEEALRAGDFRVLELNGVTSEATHIYDPSHSVLDAYKVLFRQWRWAFVIGQYNRRQGLAKPIGFLPLVRMVLTGQPPARID